MFKFKYGQILVSYAPNKFRTMIVCGYTSLQYIGGIVSPYYKIRYLDKPEDDTLSCGFVDLHYTAKHTNYHNIWNNLNV